VTVSVSLHPQPRAFQLRLLGTAELRRPDGAAVDLILAQPKRLALLAYLAMRSHAGFQRRDTLLLLFWPEFTQERARAALRRALYFLRQALGEGVIVARGDEELSIGADRIWCDAGAFREALARGELAEALVLYRGDLLPGYFVPDAPEFERWLDGERLELRRLAAEAAATLAADAERAGDLDSACSFAQRCLSLDAQSEPAFRRLAALLHTRGDRAGLAREYEAWKKSLEQEYGVPPSADTREMVAALLSVGGDGGEWTRPPKAASRSAVAAGTARTQQPRSRARTAAVWAVAPALALLLVAGVAIRRPVTLDPHRVLVSAFENHTGVEALDPIGRMAADWVARGLADTRQLVIVSHAWATVAFSHRERSERAILEETRAGTVVRGAYYLDGNQLRVQAQIVDARRGELLSTIDAAPVPVDSATAALDVLRQRIAGGIAARFSEAQYLARAHTPTYDAHAAFAEGMELFLGRADHVGALQRFNRAWALDSTFHLPRLLAAVMYMNLGEPDAGDSVMRSITPDRDMLTPYERALHDAQVSMVAGDYNAALQSMRRANELTPGALDAAQAVLAIRTNRPREALTALRRIEQNGGLQRNWFGYWWRLCTARHALGQHAQELRDARAGRREHPTRLALMEVRALAALGRVPELERLLDESHVLSVGERWTPGDAYRNAAAELRAHGHREAAARANARAIEWYRTRPPAEIARLRPMFARTLYEAGVWEEARAVYEELSAAQPRNVHYLGPLGVLAARRGDGETAERLSLALASASAPHIKGAHSLWRARIAAQLGQEDEALALLQQALREGQAYDLWLHTDADLDPLRSLRGFRTLTRPRG
jgi:DNA-binding SARP family transcriptional activator/TolB-like protein